MKTKPKELRNLTEAELMTKAHGLKEELLKLRYRAKSGRIEKPSQIRLIKRAIARINTVLREKGLKL